MTDPLIRIRNISKKYYIKRKNMFNKEDLTLTALNDINLDIYKGEVLGLVGESGSGKTTLGQVILQLIKPEKGNVYFEDTNLTSLSTEELRDFRKYMQLIFQDPKSSLNPHKKINWLLEEPLKVHGMTNKNQRLEIIKDMMNIVGLSEEYLDRYPSELSGGQAQRVSILAALIVKPKFIVADEAVSALDVSIQAQILNLLNNLKVKLNLTTLFITHDLAVCYYMSDRIAVMYLGNIVEIGSADQIYKNQHHPYTKLLFSSLLTLDKNIGELNCDDGEVGSAINIKNECPFYNRCNMRRDDCLKSLPDLFEIEIGHYSRCVLAKGNNALKG